MNIKKKKLILFDLDGVLIDSRFNMKLAWEKTCSKFNIERDFEDYFSLIGRPFPEILTILGITEKKELIEVAYIKESFHSLSEISIFDGVKNFLLHLQNNQIKIGVVTSKEQSRTEIILKNFPVNFSVIRTPDDICRGKPSPDHLLIAMATQNIDPIDTLFVGDMDVDCLAAKRAGIDYVHVNWGYGECDNSQVIAIDKITQLLQFI